MVHWVETSALYITFYHSTLTGVTKSKTDQTNHSAGYEQRIQTKVDLANHERGMTMVRSTKLP